MDNTSSKEKILQRIKEGIKKAQFKTIEAPSLNNKDIFVTPDKPLIEIFEEELTKINGQFIFCKNKEDLAAKLRALDSEKNLGLCYSPDKQFVDIINETGISTIEKFERAAEITSGISACEFLVARYGSVVVSSAQAGARRIFSFPETHIVIAYKNQLVLEIEEALDGIQKKYGENFPSQITNITGPSRTADIEKTLILGAHGPKQLIVMVLDEEKL